MTSPSHQPRPAGRSRKRRFALLAVGLGLVALAAGFLVFQLSRDDEPNLETDFSAAACEEFNPAEFAEFSGGAVELTDTTGGDYSSTGTYDEIYDGMYGIYCVYTSDSGMTLSFGANAAATDKSAEGLMGASSGYWGDAPSCPFEDFEDDGPTCFSNSYETESEQHFELLVRVGRVSAGAKLEAEPGGFEEADALDLTVAFASQALERYEAYI